MESVGESVREMLARAGVDRVPRGPIIGVLVLAIVAVVVLGGKAVSGSQTVLVESGNGDRASLEPDAALSGSVSFVESSTPDVCVHVVGAVADPGVYVMDGGARVGEAVRSAGGLLGNAAEQAVNMARPVADGEQIYVPTVDELETGMLPETMVGPGASGSSDALIDLNSADAATLEELPGIGPATAARIVADREEHGRFDRPEDLMRVSGIGEKKCEALLDLVVTR